MRTKLPARRRAVTQKVVHTDARGSEVDYLITFGFDGEGVVREVFCANPMEGSDMYALLTDGCILISLHLQTGAEIEKLARGLGENRGEGEARGKPASVFGSIARAILDLQKEISS